MLIIVYFNDLITMDEMLGRHTYPRALLDDFSDTIMKCDLIDMGFTCIKFSWERVMGTNRWMQDILDRVLVTNT